MRSLYSTRAVTGAVVLTASTLSLFTLQVFARWSGAEVHQLSFLDQLRAVLIGSVFLWAFWRLPRKTLTYLSLAAIGVISLNAAAGYWTWHYGYSRHDPFMVITAFGAFALSYEAGPRWKKCILWLAAALVFWHLRSASAKALCIVMVGAAAFVAGTRRQRVATGALAATCTGLWLACVEEYQIARVRGWWQGDPNVGWYARILRNDLSSAGLWGSDQPWEASTLLRGAIFDDVWVFWVHDHGWVLGAMVGAVFLLVVALAFRLAVLSTDRVARILAVGIGAYWLCSFVVSVGGVFGFVPMMGITLPLMALGTSSTLAGFATLGVLLRIGRELDVPLGAGEGAPLVG